MLKDIEALATELNKVSGICIDINNRDAIISLLTRGLYLPEQDHNVQININLAVFHICSAFITASLRFKLPY
jgi:hypothetical protein